MGNTSQGTNLNINDEYRNELAMEFFLGSVSEAINQIFDLFPLLHLKGICVIL